MHLWRLLASLAVAALTPLVWPQAAQAQTQVVPSWSFTCDSAKKAAIFPIGIKQGTPGVTYQVTIDVIGKGVFGPVSVRMGETRELLVYAKGAYRITAKGGNDRPYSSYGPQPIPCIAIAATATAPTMAPKPAAAKAPATKPKAAGQLGSSPRAEFGAVVEAFQKWWRDLDPERQYLIIGGLFTLLVDAAGLMLYWAWCNYWWRPAPAAASSTRLDDTQMM